VIFAAAMILFVVVCPATPTPIAVVTTHGKAPAPAPALAVAAVFVLPVVLRVAHSFASFCRLEALAPSPAEVRDLTCTWLC
jgi:hypothetical protein